MRRHLRLRHARDFARLRREGRVFRHPLFLISIVSNDLAHNRYGVVVGKRVGNAVVRNRIRRLIRESLRLLHPSIRIGYDIAVIAHPTRDHLTLQIVQVACEQLLREANLIVEGSES